MLVVSGLHDDSSGYKVDDSFRTNDLTLSEATDRMKSPYKAQVLARDSEDLAEELHYSRVLDIESADPLRQKK